VHLVGFTIEIYYDARYYKLQIRHMKFDSVVLYVTINIYFHVPIDIFGPIILQIRFLETTKEVHKFINIL
jgi:hypothetical protein